jgi:hypothetical protein
MPRKRVTAPPENENYAKRRKNPWSIDHADGAKLRTHSVDKIVSKEPRTTASACSIRKKFPSSKMRQDFCFPMVDAFLQFLTFFVDNIVSNGLAETQSH